ncbi:MAG: hypothetical protein LQ346_005282 [Caloplaca aetnensis]|nr:MAG: hypothetical protein LQ346_005282 [Caloplaca aetnensis]
MHFSHYLEKAVFFEQSPAASQLFEEKTDQLFEKSSERSYVEIHVQSPFQSQLKHDLPGSPISPDSSYVDLSVDFQFKSSTVLDPNFDCQEEPPGYVGSRRSQTPHLVKDTTTLTRIAATDKVLIASIDDQDPLKLLDIEERQALKDFEDKVLDVLLALDSTTHTIETLTEKYNRLCQDQTFFGEEVGRGDYDCIAVALQEKGQEIVLTRTKLSSLLDLGNGYALKVLAEESRKENAAMRGLAEKSTRDAAAVKVLTVIALVYLPVAGFFSTQFIQWESRDNGTSSLVVTHEAWLLAAIAAPLTLFTLILWWVWTRLQTPRELGASRTLDLLPFQAILKRRRLKRQLSELE